MKISQEEIDAALSAFNAFEFAYREGTQGEAMEVAIAAALMVRKQRKAAKRERQRKEKDEKKQYVIQTWRGKRIPDLSMEELETAKEYYSFETLASVKDVATYRQILCEIIERKEKDTHISECVKGAVAFAEKVGKEKDKQAVESVKPATFADFCEGGDKDFADKHYPSKAPEWDGTLKGDKS